LKYSMVWISKFKCNS